MDTPTKEIIYRGGIEKFRLPASWREEYERRGGATFYEDKQESRTLRLNVISAHTPEGQPSEDAIEQAFRNDASVILPSGLRMRRRTVETAEEGTRLLLHNWEIAVPVPPARVRIVCFTHTVLAEEAKDPATLWDLQFIEEMIRDAEYSRETGSLSAWQTLKQMFSRSNR